MISRSTDIRSALKSKQRGFLLNPARFGGSSPPPTDPYFSDVSLLLYGNGTNGGTTFTDSSGSPKTMTANGNVQTSTAQSVYGGSSMLFDGTGDYLQTPYNAGFDFSSGAFTVDCYFRLASIASDCMFAYFGKSNAAAGIEVAWALSYRSSTGKVRFFFYYGATQYVVDTTTTISANTWYFVEAVRFGANTYIFLDGTLEATTGLSNFPINSHSTWVLNVGKYVDSDTRYMNGYLSMIRLTKGVARNTTTFTPAALPFPNS